MGGHAFCPPPGSLHPKGKWSCAASSTLPSASEGHSLLYSRSKQVMPPECDFHPDLHWDRCILPGIGTSFLGRL